MRIVERRPNGSLRVAIDFKNTVSLTDQSQQKACDINEIIRKYKKTGELPKIKMFQGTYSDISEIGDLQECIEKVQRANEAFMLLPAEVRKKFENDPTQLVSFIQDEKNYDEAVKLGLIEQKQIDTAVVPPADVKKD